MVEETGKPVELARGETDAAVEMGLFVAGEGRRSYGRTTTASMEHRTVLTLRQPLGVAALIMSFNTPLPNVAWKAFPADLLRQRGGGEAVRAHARVGLLLRGARARGRRPAGRAQRRPRARQRGGRGARRAPGRRSRQLHRLGGDRPRDQRGGRAPAREDVPRARRQERARRVRRRRPRPGGRVDRSRRRSRTRDSGARRRAGSSCSTRSTTSSATASSRASAGSSRSP